MHRNLDHLLIMDVDKLKSLADIKSLSLSKNRALNKIVKEIESRFDDLENT